jgi:hypothetical protein
MLEEGTGLRGRASAWECGTPSGGEQAIRRRRTERAQERAGRRVEGEFAVPLERVEQIGQSRHEPFTANPARDFPEPHERALDDGRIPLRAWPGDRPTTRRGRMTQEGDRIFAVIPRRRNELVEDARFVPAGRRDVARGNGRQQFAFARRTHHRLVFLPCAERTGRGKIYS